MPVASTGTRDSRAVLLLGNDGWVVHKEGGVVFSLDVTRVMFSSGMGGGGCLCLSVYIMACISWCVYHGVCISWRVYHGVYSMVCVYHGVYLMVCDDTKTTNHLTNPPDKHSPPT